MRVCIKCGQRLYPEGGWTIGGFVADKAFEWMNESVSHCVNDKCDRYGLLTIVWKEV